MLLCAGELAEQSDIDGFLVGGASLEAISFKDIVGATAVDLYPHGKAPLESNN